MEGVNALNGLTSFLLYKFIEKFAEKKGCVNALNGLTSFLRNSWFKTREIEESGVNALNGLTSFLRGPRHGSQFNLINVSTP